MLTQRRASLLDARELVRDVRPEDRLEWETAAEAFGHTAPLVGLICGCISQGLCLTTLEGSKVLCIWGASEYRPGVGLAWLIATNLGQSRARRLQRFFRSGIAELHERWPVLEAHAFNDNPLHHHWMLRLGFARGGPSELVPGGRFTQFTRDSRTDVPRPYLGGDVSHLRCLLGGGLCAEAARS